MFSYKDFFEQKETLSFLNGLKSVSSILVLEICSARIEDAQTAVDYLYSKSNGCSSMVTLSDIIMRDSGGNQFFSSEEVRLSSAWAERDEDSVNKLIWFAHRVVCDAIMSKNDEDKWMQPLDESYAVIIAIEGQELTDLIGRKVMPYIDQFCYNCGFERPQVLAVEIKKSCNFH